MSAKGNICRLCMETERLSRIGTCWSSKQFMPSIFQDPQWIQQIFLCTGLNITYSAKLPDRICRNCIKLLKMASAFRKRCRDTNKYLQTVLTEAKFKKERMKTAMVHRKECAKSADIVKLGETMQGIRKTIRNEHTYPSRGYTNDLELQQAIPIEDDDEKTLRNIESVVTFAADNNSPHKFNLLNPNFVTPAEFHIFDENLDEGKAVQVEERAECSSVKNNHKETQGAVCNEQPHSSVFCMARSRKAEIPQVMKSAPTDGRLPRKSVSYTCKQRFADAVHLDGYCFSFPKKNFSIPIPAVKKQDDCRNAVCGNVPDSFQRSEVHIDAALRSKATTDDAEKCAGEMTTAGLQLLSAHLEDEQPDPDDQISDC